MTLPEPWVEDLATVPELQTILRRGLLSKARVFSAWCEKGDRLLQVVRVGGRPLAFARELRPTVIMQVGAPARHTLRNLTPPQKGMWLDLDPHLYYLPHEPPPVGESRIMRPLRFPGQCRHERVSIPADWLRGQVEKGVTYRMIDAATRREMGTRPRGA